MKSCPRRFILTGPLLAVVIGGLVWLGFQPKEPFYGGKKLSAWLDEFPVEVHGTYDATAPAVLAARAIGTNAIPWLVAQFRSGELTWRGKVNWLLDKQPVVKYRLHERIEDRWLNPRLRRGIHGIEALGEAAAPAVSKLLKLVDRHPAHIPGTLVWIGHPAIPAVQQCLTNMRSYRSPIGFASSIPADTLIHIENAHSAGRLSNSDIEMLLPAIRAWAQQTTNSQASMFARSILRSVKREEW